MKIGHFCLLAALIFESLLSFTLFEEQLPYYRENVAVLFLLLSRQKFSIFRFLILEMKLPMRKGLGKMIDGGEKGQSTRMTR